jgi:hypothetical protein
VTPQLTLALAILPALMTAQAEPALAPDDPRILVWYDFDGEDVEKVHKFSFIGDTPGRDRSDAVMWVDDLLLMADRPVPRPVPFVAPGRRMLFVDLYRRGAAEAPGLPTTARAR